MVLLSFSFFFLLNFVTDIYDGLIRLQEIASNEVHILMYILYSSIFMSTFYFLSIIRM